MANYSKNKTNYYLYGGAAVVLLTAAWLYLTTSGKAALVKVKAWFA
jgi:hypothetical protein